MQLLYGAIFIALAAISVPIAPAAAQIVCLTPPLQCCQEVEPASNPSAAMLLSLLGIVVQNPDTPIGLSCTPFVVSMELHHFPLSVNTLRYIAW